MKLGMRLPMLLLAFIAGWLAAGPLLWASNGLLYAIPTDWATMHLPVWEFSWRCAAIAVKFFVTGFVYVLGLREDWRLSGLWVWVGALLLSAFDGHTLSLGMLPVLVGAAAAFLGTWLAQSRAEHPAVEKMREVLYWMIPQGG